MKRYSKGIRILLAAAGALPGVFLILISKGLVVGHVPQIEQYWPWLPLGFLVAGLGLTSYIWLIAYREPDGDQ